MIHDAAASAPPGRTIRTVRTAALALALAVGAWAALAGLAAVRAEERLPLWDAAGNAWGAVELAAALGEGRLLDFLVRLNEQDKWPFGYSLASLPFVAAGGGSRESAAWLPALAFALVPALLLLAGRELGLARRAEEEGAGLAAGAVAGALWLAAPLPRAFATVAMRETSGAALTVAAFAAYLAARRRGTLGAWRRCGIVLLALFCIKYNYFLLVATGLGLHAVLAGDPFSRSQRLARLRKAVIARGWRSPLRWLLLLGVAAAASLAVGRNPGGAVYGCMVVTTVLALARHRQRLGGWMAEARSRNPAGRGLVETLLLPVWIWCLSPDPIHPRSIFAFLQNRGGSGELPPLEMLAYYPRAFAEQYSADARLGVTVAFLAAAGLLVSLLAPAAAGEEGARALAITAGLASVLVAVHPMREARFLATISPFVFLLAATTAIELARAARRFVSRPPPRRGAAALLLAGALALPYAAALLWDGGSTADARLAGDHRLLTGDRTFARPLEELVRRVSRSGEQRVALLGGFNELSDALVRWEAWRRSGSEAPLARSLRGLDGGDPPGRVRRRFAAWLERERPARVVTLRPFARSAAARSADYQRWNAWQETAIAALAADPAWRPTRRLRLRAAEVEIVTFVRR